MGERFREHDFVLLRIALLLILEIYIVLSRSVLTGASVKVLLLLALLIGVIAGKELVELRLHIFIFGGSRSFTVFFNYFSGDNIYFARYFLML